MSSQVSEIDPVTVEVAVEVPWDRIQKGMDETYSKLARTARVKGFRPGKAPKSVLQKLYSKDVQEEVVGALVQESLVEAVRKHELPVVSSPVVEKRPEVEKGQPLAFKAKFEIRPKVEKLETKLALERPLAEVKDADVDQEVERLRMQHAIVRPIEGARPAAKGDLLVIDYEVEIDGEKKADMKGEGRTVQLGEGRLLDEIDEGLVGATVGEKRSIRIERPETDPNPDFAGKKVSFDVTVKELRERVLPELDDELAKDVGEYQTLLELRLKLRERLEEAAKGRAQDRLRELAVEKLVEKNPIPVPPSLVDQQLRSMLGEYLQILKMIGQKPDLTEAGVEEMKKRAEQKVRAAILLGELSRRESIQVGEADVDARIRQIAERTGKHVAKVKADHSGEKREQLETQILEDKLIQYLLDNASITDASPAAAETEKKEEEGSTAPAEKAPKKAAKKKPAAKAEE
jgi:trigger factor